MSIEAAIFELLNKDRFFAEVILMLDRIRDPKIPMGGAGVTIVPKPTLRYHPDVFIKNSRETGANLLKHEVLHLMLGHLTRGGKWTLEKNVAADLAVNCMIPGFQTLNMYDEKTDSWSKQDLCTVEILGKQIPNILPNQTYEWYLKLLQQEGKEKSRNGDDHSGWEEGAGSELSDNQVKGLIQEGYERAVRAGSQPSSAVVDLVKRLLAGHNPWRRELQRFPQDAEITAHEGTWRRRNRRIPLAQPGSKPIRKTKIAVGIDVSGSVDTKLRNEFYSEVFKIEASGAEVIAVFFDSTVCAVVPWAEISRFKKTPGGGGTNFAPPIQKAKDLKVDGLIMLTDGMNQDTISKPRFPVIWAIPKTLEFSAPFGKKIQLELGG